MKKQTKHDSCDGVKQSVQVAICGIELPSHLRVTEQMTPFLQAILELRQFDQWNKSDLAKAVNLARAQYDIERISAEIEEEGDTQVNDRGTIVNNPKHSLLETITRRELALSRAIHVHAEATLGRSRDTGGKAKQQKAKLTAIDSARDKAKGLIGGL